MRVCTCNQYVGPSEPWTGPYSGNCSLCWTYQTAPEYAAWRIGAPPRTRVCRHKGAEVRRASCPTCSGQVVLKVFGCAIHGECTTAKPLPGAACCLACPDHRPRPTIQVEHPSGGIGDHLLSLTVAAGLKQEHPESEIVLVCPTTAHPWVALFDGADHVTSASVPAPTCFLDNSIDAKIEFDRRRTPRWQAWAEQVGVRTVLPAPNRLPADAVGWAERLAGRVVLAPFAANGARTWPLKNWLELEDALIAHGFYCVVLDDRQDRTASFRSEKLLNEAPARVAAVIQNTVCFVGNDSGMAHLAGMLRVPAVAVCSHVSDERIFGLYPTVASLGGGEMRLEDIRPPAVLAAVLTQTRKDLGDLPVERFLSQLVEGDRWRAEAWLPVYAALWRTVRELAPKTIVEIGVRAGYSSWIMLEACPGASIHGIDFDQNLHGGFHGAWRHAEKINAGKNFRMQIADSHTLETLPPCDLCYIDGDHSEEGCYADLLLAERSGAGTMLCDDYTNVVGVKAAVKRFLAARPHLRGRFIPSLTGWYLIERS